MKNKFKAIGFYLSVLMLFGVIIGLAIMLGNRWYSYLITLLAIACLIYTRQKLHLKLMKFTGIFLLVFLISLLSLVYGRADLSTSFYVDLTAEGFKTLAMANQTFADSKEPSEVEIPVLIYHMVKPSPDPNDPYQYSLINFEEQMIYLHEHGYQTLTIDQYFNILEGKTISPENPILLTFDDGTGDFYDYVFPVLEKYHMHATTFIVSGWINEQLNLTQEELLIIKENGIDVQNHTETHRNLAKLSKEDQYREIKNAEMQLKQLTDEKPTVLATPYARGNHDTTTITKDLGFRGTFSGLSGGMSTELTDRHQLPRIGMIQSYELDEFIRMLELGY